MSGITIFVRVVDYQGFSSAARSLELSTSYVSRQISALENGLGVRLLNRSTRRQSLTPVGALFYRNCSSILAQLEEAELAITQMQTVPRGLLRVHAPEGFGSRYIGHVMAEFMGTYEDLEVELVLDNRRVDPVEEGFDIVIRLGETAGNRHLSARVAPLRRYMVASTAYLEEHGRPQIPSELANHDCLVLSQDGGNVWELHSDSSIEKVGVKAVLASNSEAVLRSAMLAGRGIAYLPDHIVGADIASGAAHMVMPEWQEKTVGVHAVYPEQKHLSARVRLFIQAIKDYLGAKPPWNPDGYPDEPDESDEPA